MVVTFSLAVNFGANQDRAVEAERTVLGMAPFNIEGVAHHLQPPRITRTRSGYVDFSTEVRRTTRSRLDPMGPAASEVVEMATCLCGVLRQFDDYAAAAVGWDPGWKIHPMKLRNHLSEKALRDLNGLVLREGLAQEWNLHSLEPFRPGYRWVPW